MSLLTCHPCVVYTATTIYVCGLGCVPEVDSYLLPDLVGCVDTSQLCTIMTVKMTPS